MSMTNDRSVVRSILNSAFVLLGLFPAVAHAQEATTVSGKVTATVGGAPLVGATVSIPALRVGAITDAEGRYRFTVPGSATGEVTLTARRIGYVTRSVQALGVGAAGCRARGIGCRAHGDRHHRPRGGEGDEHPGYGGSAAHRDGAQHHPGTEPRAAGPRQGAWSPDHGIRYAGWLGQRRHPGPELHYSKQPAAVHRRRCSRVGRGPRRQSRRYNRQHYRSRFFHRVRLRKRADRPQSRRCGDLERAQGPERRRPLRIARSERRDPDYDPARGWRG